MELAQNLLALPDQGKPNPSAQNARLTSPVSAEVSELSPGPTPEKNIQNTNGDVTEFGIMLNHFFDATQADISVSNKNILLVDVKNFSALPAASVSATASSASITPKPELDKSGVPLESSLASLNLLTAQTNLQNEAGSAAQPATYAPQSAILYSNVETPITTEVATAEHKAPTISPALPDALPARTAILDIPLINSPAQFGYQFTLSDESTANQFTPLADKLQNSTTVISEATATVDPAQRNPQPLQPTAPPAGEVTQNADASTGTGDGKLIAASEKIVPDVPVNTTETARAPVAREGGQTPVVTNQTSASVHGAPESKVSDQILAPEKPTDILTIAPAIAPQKRSSDHKTSVPTMSISGYLPGRLSPDSSVRTSDDNADIRIPPNSTVSALTQQTSPTGQLLPSADMTQATENISATVSQQALPQDKAPAPPLHDPGADRNSVSSAIPSTVPAAQTHNATSPQLTTSGVQNLSQTPAQNPDGLPVSAPENPVSVASAEVSQDETGNIIILDKPESVRSSITPAIARPDAPSHPVSPPIRDIAVHISQHADTGINRFQLRLDPPELGRVEVRMEISAEGKLSAVIAVERPETLDLLQRDSRALERGLIEAGLKTDSNALSFSLKGGRHDNQNSGASNSGFDKSDAALMEEWDEAVAPAIARFANRSVNIRV